MYVCFFCKKKLIFYSGHDLGSEYHADKTTIVGWQDARAPHEVGPLTAKWLKALSCSAKRSLEGEWEFEIATVMTQ